jgi:prepilin-type N-terminal cleavage/methylation domain-containing protein
MRNRKGFTLVELMVVILIVGILAAVAIPLMQGRISKAKWSEANATAGTIRTAVRAYVAETSVTTASTNLTGKALSDATTQSRLGFSTNDLNGTYFAPANYVITSIDATTGNPLITISGQTTVPGSATLAANGTWTITGI